MTELTSAAAAADENRIDVISVQSQVIYGGVGNNIAAPALARHGLRVLAVPTVLLSNTPHYATFYGGEIPAEWFRGFFRGFRERGLDKHARMAVTGYLGKASKAQDLAEWLREMRTINPAMQVIIDPVLGDEDTGFYVEPALAEWYRNELVPLATGTTPNRFELACLTNSDPHTDEEIIHAARTLLSPQTRWVIVTSASRTGDRGLMKVIGVTHEDEFIIEHPCHPGPPRGTGDLFTAELTAALLAGCTLQQAAERASEFTQQRVHHALEQGQLELSVS